MPNKNAPLGLWLNRVLGENRGQLTAKTIKWSLGNEAEHAFAFDGVEFLVDFLVARSKRGPAEHAYVLEGVTELVNNLRPGCTDRSYGAVERLRVLESTRAAEEKRNIPATMQEALEAAKHFFLLARASLERAKFGTAMQAADIACFETFRVASIAIHTDAQITSTEESLLARIASWHHTSEEQLAHLLGLMSAGVELVSNSIASSAHHSLVLHVAAANTTVEKRLRSCALHLMDTTLRLDGITKAESHALETPPQQSPNDRAIADDLALVKKSIFIVPGKRAGLMADPEFDDLKAVYNAAVPWSTPTTTAL